MCEHRALEEQPGGLHQTNENPVARGRPGQRLSQWARKEVGRGRAKGIKGEGLRGLEANRAWRGEAKCP